MHEIFGGCVFVAGIWAVCGIVLMSGYWIWRRYRK